MEYHQPAEKPLQLSARVIGILRGVSEREFPFIMEAAFEAGLDAIEVTTNTPGAAGIVSANLRRVPPGKWLGMGTVRKEEEAQQAIDAGAMFLVSPNVNEAVIQKARQARLPMIAGAFTPTEVYNAWAAGAGQVKVFPANRFGPNYLRDLKGPYDHIPLVAVGGVTVDNVADYFSAGASAVAATSALFGRDALRSVDLEALRNNIYRFLSSCSGTPK